MTRPGPSLRGHRRDRGGVKAAAHQHARGAVGRQAPADGELKALAHVLGEAGFRGRPGAPGSAGSSRWPPWRRCGSAAASRRGQGGGCPSRGSRSRVVSSCVIQWATLARVGGGAAGQQRDQVADLAREGDAARALVQEQRAHAELVAREEPLAALLDPRSRARSRRAAARARPRPSVASRPRSGPRRSSPASYRELCAELAGVVQEAVEQAQRVRPLPPAARCRRRGGGPMSVSVAGSGASAPARRAGCGATARVEDPCQPAAHACEPSRRRMACATAGARSPGRSRSARR